MAQSTAEGDAVHKKNSADIVAQLAVNTAKAATVPPNVGRSEPALDLRIMQGTANGVVPNRVLSSR